MPSRCGLHLIHSLVLFLILFSAGNARSPYLLVMKNDFFKGYSADTVCMNEGMDSNSPAGTMPCTPPKARPVSRESFGRGTTLLFGALLKEPIETRYIIRVGRGINRTEAVLTCDF